MHTNGVEGEQTQCWQEMLNEAIKSIVAIRFSQVSSFDTEAADTSEATGFIVDAERGIILTNRHVVGSGPFVGEALFHDHEEIDVQPIYRDPIHDFGFLKFQPHLLKYTKPRAIPLRPDLAAVGLSVRIVGNDAGEKLSILSGSISRLDRNAPDYGQDPLTFSDSDTFYLQAASSTSGGSSGSPVLSITGDCVALQAGGHSRAATDFFFPLDRVKRALELLQAGQAITRGTIQTQWFHRPFDEIRRLGFRQDTEAEIRALFPDEIGMLVAEIVLPKGPACPHGPDSEETHLEEGDVLVSVNGQRLTKFVPLEELLDEHVGKPLAFTVQRGGEDVEMVIVVQDLHSITPDRYLEVGGARLNNLSYQLARQFAVPVEGIYIAEPAGMFRMDGSSDDGWMLKSVDAKPVRNLEEFIAVFKDIADRERVPITYYSIADVHTINMAVVSVERHWTSFRLRIRDDSTGLWNPVDLGQAKPPKPIVPVSANFATLDSSLGDAKDLLRSFCKVSYYMPLRLDGFPKTRKVGAGIIVDAKKGLVVVGKYVVPFDLGDLSITFADSVVVPAKVVYIHPIQNVAIVQYDPKDIADTPVRAIEFADEPSLMQGQDVTFFAFNHNFRPLVTKTTVTDITSVVIPHSSTPRFRATNFDAIQLDTPLTQQCNSGVIILNGQVRGLWFSFLGERTTSGNDHEYHLGISIPRSLLQVIRNLQMDRVPTLRGLAVEVMSILLAQARQMGLPDEWIGKVEAASPARRQLFLIRRVEAGSATATVLRDLDLILDIDGKVITSVNDLDLSQDMAESVEMVCIFCRRS